jgi:uncharacterized protein YbjQ (UPF0145 family)
MSASGAEAFTSDLTVSEFALLHAEGIRPLRQVMGSSIFQRGWQGLPAGVGSGWGGRSGRMWTSELTQVSGAYNASREHALSRLRQEAVQAGADAVVGVLVRTGRDPFGEVGTVEFTAIGTAVRLPPALRTPEPVITDLSGPDYVKLAAAGYRPVGVVGVTTVVYVASSARQAWVLASGNSIFSVAGQANQELTDFTEGFYQAREIALGHLNRQASGLGAHGIVGVSIRQEMAPYEYDAGGRQQRDLIVTLHLLGTAITEGHEPVRPVRVAPVIPVSARL